MHSDRTYRSPADFQKIPLLSYLKQRALWLFGKRAPFLAYLKITKRCNLDCHFCPWHTAANDFADELPTEQWTAILDSLHSQGVQLFVFEGGEPTLRADLQTLIDHAHSLGAHSILATNGIARDPWLFEPTAYTVSVDGTAATHDAVRGSGAFQRLLRRLDARGKRKVFAISVISRQNQSEIEAICELVGERVSGILFTFLYPYEGTNGEPLNPEEIRRAKRRILNMKRRCKIINPSAFLERPLNETSCHDELTVSVSHRGEVRHGCFVQHVEPKDCEKCELSCFHLVSAFHNFNLESWFNLNRYILSRV